MIVDIIRILCISILCGYYLHFVDIIHILWILWIYPHFMDIICIGHITSYLARNVCPIFHIYSSSVSDWCMVATFCLGGLHTCSCAFRCGPYMGWILTGRLCISYSCCDQHGWLPPYWVFKEVSRTPS